MSQDEKVFANGFSFKRRENAPEFVVGRLSLKVDDAMAFVKEHMSDGWIHTSLRMRLLHLRRQSPMVYLSKLF